MLISNLPRSVLNSDLGWWAARCGSSCRRQRSVELEARYSLSIFPAESAALIEPCGNKTIHNKNSCTTINIMWRSLENLTDLSQVWVTAVGAASVPFQEVLLRSLPVSLCSSFQGILGSVEAVHQPHHEVGDPGADGHYVGPLGCVWTQTPDEEVAQQEESAVWIR